MIHQLLGPVPGSSKHGVLAAALADITGNQLPYSKGAKDRLRSQPALPAYVTPRSKDRLCGKMETSWAHIKGKTWCIVE